MNTPRVPPTKVTYETPKGGLDPFDVDEARTQHVVEARGWGYGWVPGDERVVPGSVYDDIPMGYRYLAIVEKLAIVVDGRVVREWPVTEASDHSFRRSVAYDRGAGVGEVMTEAAIDRYWSNDAPWAPWTHPYRVQTQNLRDLDEPCIIGGPDYETAIALARELKVATPAMVSRVLSHQSWH
ncbi:hypothetical protein [Actinoallomurus iriomotensis]|uniref:Uncharacterized protein n=1 Tax=Actinoallomurus iriomotensis TaxID=478107 RepID=A0A9W6SAZ5_9ACTN|nr:hypothetical protein [Actinoallomurus iriomotensis]GLY90273.1 hypothetical protein Airi02_082020 [Actinoallomurus iriomotensis]